MMCPHCKATNIEPVQESKEDYWKCHCGDYHKGFPYKCPNKKITEAKQWKSHPTE